MPHRWQQIKSWRDRAGELRRIAGDLIAPARENVIRSAEDYEHMADELERKLRILGVDPPQT